MDTTHVSDMFEALPEPVAPLNDAPTGPCAGKDGPDARVDHIEVPEELLQIEVQVFQEIHFVDQYQVGRAEHERVLKGFLLPFCDGVDHYPDILTYPELGGTHQVPHVLDDKYVYLVEGEFAEAGADHVGVQMALAAETRVGIHLHQRDVETGQPVGVQGGLYVAFENAETELITQPLQGTLQQRRLSRSRRAHHVDRVRPGPVERIPVCPGERVVGVQDVLADHFLDRSTVHPYASSNSRDSTISSSPVSLAAGDPDHRFCYREFVQAPTPHRGRRPRSLFHRSP